ncbi:MAG TPA: STAS domain-containing protein, partial [Bacteroidales bacterium]|nr:STAS domain-containing protein [Bacteroidales bacterium]
LTVFVDLTVAIEVGVVLASLLFMKRMSDASMLTKETIDKDILENYAYLPKELAIYEISGPFFFGSAKSYCNTLREIGSKAKVLIIRMRHVPFVDATAIHNLQDVIRELQHDGIKIILSGVNEQVYNELEKNRIVFLVGKNNVVSTFDKALQVSYAYLGKEEKM